MVSETKTSWNSNIGTRLSSISGGQLLPSGALGSEPQFPVDGVPGKGSGGCLPQEPNVFIVEPPVVAPGSKVLNCGTIFHKAWGFTRIAAGTDPHKHMKSLNP